MGSRAIATRHASPYHHHEALLTLTSGTVVPASALLLAVRPDPSVWSRDEIVSGVIRLSLGVAVAFAIWWLVRRLPWPRPFRLRFVAAHLVAAVALALGWS